jgi:hypothetical protein
MDREEKIRRLADQSPHAGEREAARAALARMKAKEKPREHDWRVVMTLWNGATITFEGDAKCPISSAG